MGIFDNFSSQNGERSAHRSLHSMTLGVVALIILMLNWADNQGMLLFGSDVLSSRHDVFSSQSKGCPAAGRASMLIDRDRTLWMAGWHARFARYYEQTPPILTWTQEAEEYVEQQYRRLHFPSSCDQVKGYITTNAYAWGVMSALRDYQSDILRAMAQNYTLVHKGEYYLCPDQPDRFLNCFWEDLNGCQGLWGEAPPDIPRVELSQGTTTAIMGAEEFPHWLWDELYQRRLVYLRDADTGKAISEADVQDADQYFQLKLSVLRAILTKRILKPRAHIRAIKDALVRDWQKNTNALGTGMESNKGLIVHLRRTDKKIDLGPHWHHIDFQSTAHLGAMIQAMESVLNTSFAHVFAMSDDPNMEMRAVDELNPFFASSPAKLTSHHLCDLVGANHAEYNGHETLNATQRHELYNIVISQMYAAVEVADYLVGSGSCGVSQFMAQLLGAKHRIEPSLFTMWEEDIIVKKCRWILRQREALSEHCSLSRPSPPTSTDILLRSYQKALFDGEWGALNCPTFSYAVPDCIAE